MARKAVRVAGVVCAIVHRGHLQETDDKQQKHAEGDRHERRCAGDVKGEREGGFKRPYSHDRVLRLGGDSIGSTATAACSNERRFVLVVENGELSQTHAFCSPQKYKERALGRSPG